MWHRFPQWNTLNLLNHRLSPVRIVDKIPWFISGNERIQFCAEQSNNVLEQNRMKSRVCVCAAFTILWASIENFMSIKTLLFFWKPKLWATKYNFMEKLVEFCISLTEFPTILTFNDGYLCSVPFYSRGKKLSMALQPTTIVRLRSSTSFRLCH